MLGSVKNKLVRYKYLVLYFKIVITVSLCFFILWNNDWEIFRNKLQDLKLWLIPLVFLFYLAAQAISAFKWKLVLSIHGIHFDFKKLHSYYYTAMFFNNFLPTSIGGDGYRIYKTLSNPKSKSGAVIAILMERISGVIALLLMGFIGGLVGLIRDGGFPIHPFVDSAWLNYLGVIFAGVVFSGVMNVRADKGGFLSRPFREISPHLRDYAKNLKKTLWVFLISFFFHVLSMFRWFLLVVITGESCSIFDLVFVVVLSTFVGMVPFSLNGIGLMDTSFIFLIGHYGVSYEAALMVMILTRLLLVPISLIGGLAYLKEKEITGPGNKTNGV